MPPKVTRRPAEGESSEETDGSPKAGPPTWVFHVVERGYYRPLGLVTGSKVVCTGGWQHDRLKGQRLEFISHIWNLNVGREYLRCWWPRGGQWVSLPPDQARPV